MIQAPLKSFENYPKGARAILLSAEQLFGEYGLDGASLRQILAAAKQANSSAVQHYFGSKQGLIQAVYEMRAPLIEAERQRMLDQLDSGAENELTQLMMTLFIPILKVLPDPDRSLYARFAMQLLPLDRDTHPHFKSGHLCEPSFEIERRLFLLFDKLPADVVNTRIRMAAAVFLHGIADEPRVYALPNTPYCSAQDYWAEIMQMTLTVMTAPYPPAKIFCDSCSRD